MSEEVEFVICSNCETPCYSFELDRKGNVANGFCALCGADEAKDFLAEKGYDERMGARPLSRVIQEHIKKPLADEILFGKLKDGGIVKIDIDPADTEKLKLAYSQESRGLLSFGRKPEKA